VTALHTRSPAHVSAAQETASCPRPSTDNPRTGPRWRANEPRSVPVATSQRLMDMSALALRAYEPSGASHTLLTALACPVKRRFSAIAAPGFGGSACGGGACGAAPSFGSGGAGASGQRGDLGLSEGSGKTWGV